MPATQPTRYDVPIMGTDGSDRITVERSISFQWMPADTNAFVVTWLGPGGVPAPDGPPEWTGSSAAKGYVTLNGVTSSEPFRVDQPYFDFRFTDRDAYFPSYFPPDAEWSYNPATNVLDLAAGFAEWDGQVWARLTSHAAFFGTQDKEGAGINETEYGHWQLVPDLHNVNIFGGAGNDTILGGQGREMLFGGDGNDLIRASVGEDLLSGGAGSDRLYAGFGKQTLMGGAGDDTIWGGTGAQMLLGDDGNDMIHAGFGPQTLMGGSGNDTLWGGSGPHLLAGGDGADVLNAGSGNETLSGGAGRDIFVFSAAKGDAVITDFQSGQDIIMVKANFGGLMLNQARDLLPDIASDSQGNAVLTVGNDFSLLLQHITLEQIEAHPAHFFKVAS